MLYFNLLVISCLSCSWSQTAPLKVTQLEVVPSNVQLGEDVRLRCIYSSPNIDIITIKWFFDDEQFFRYMAMEDPPTEFYPPQDENGQTKINIERTRSNGSEVYLTDVKFSASGTYRCVVTEDGPYFRHDSMETNITVKGGGGGEEISETSDASKNVNYIIQVFIFLGVILA